LFLGWVIFENMMLIDHSTCDFNLATHFFITSIWWHIFSLLQFAPKTRVHIQIICTWVFPSLL
jgi:hypothetical protein